MLPVLRAWADWNDGSGAESWHRWDKNSLNAARGGPAKRPVELLDDGPCRKLVVRDPHLRIVLPEFQASVAVRLKRVDA